MTRNHLFSVTTVPPELSKEGIFLSICWEGRGLRWGGEPRLPPGQLSLLQSPLAWEMGFDPILHLSLLPSHALGPSPSYLCQIAWHLWIADKRLDCPGSTQAPKAFWDRLPRGCFQARDLHIPHTPHHLGWGRELLLLWEGKRQIPLARLNTLLFVCVYTYTFLYIT